jgi:putative FmdB family regulatory protein
MPIYEYQCQACGHALEALQKMSDAPLVDCPECGKADLKKQVSAAAFKLKGSGWYETDFKNSGKKPAAKSDSGKSSSKADKPAGTASSTAGSTKTTKSGTTAS